MKQEKAFCDICSAEIGGTVEQRRIPVTFTTEQTEGRAMTPTLTSVSLDVCADCLKRITDEQPLRGAGAMGHNTYTWRNK